MAQNKIYVYAGWEDDKEVGMLYSNIANGEEVVSFEYNEEWLASHVNLCLDPTIAQTPYRTYSQDKALFAAFQDSCPDRWGRTLIDRRENALARQENRHPHKFTESEYMLGIQDQCRSGGFRFKTDRHGEFLANNELSVPPISSLRTLEQISLGYENNSDNRWITQLVAPGSSLGGARPKANVTDTDGSLWIAKFPSKHDDYDVGAWEKTVHDLAKQCGIVVPDAKLYKCSDAGSIFLVRRFDRINDTIDDIKRLHFASAMTMLGLRDGKTNDAGYLNIAEIIERNASNPNLQLEQLYRRMVFDISVSNKDNHLRNHGFLLIDGKWSLSPAYDINPVYNAEYLDLNIDTEDGYRSFDKAIETCMFYHLSESEAKDVVKQTAEIVQKNWRRQAERNGLNREAQSIMAPAFELAEKEAIKQRSFCVNMEYTKSIVQTLANNTAEQKEKLEQFNENHKVEGKLLDAHLTCDDDFLP